MRTHNTLPHDIPMNVGKPLVRMQDSPAVVAAHATNATPQRFPRVGQAWAGQGGRLIAIVPGRNGAPDYGLVLADEVPVRMNWRDSMAWAASVQADGHKDFELPNRQEAALLFAICGEVGDKSISGWHWTSEEFDGSYAWSCYFSYGNQGGNHKSFEGCARAVRRVTL
jgi:hypothetical protein